MNDNSRYQRSVYELWLNIKQWLVYHVRPVNPELRMLPSSSGKDAALSRLKHEFDSRREHQH